jgi:Thioesterase superfamily
VSGIFGGTVRATVGDEDSAVFEWHPGLSGRASEARAMADELRRLIRLSVSAAPPAGETAELTRRLAAVADQLERHVPASPFPRFLPSGDGEMPRDRAIGTSMPFDLIFGAFNPLALPVRVASEPPKALGYATFDVAYEGAPGCVHGGALAATFDMILTGANALAGSTGPTVRLSLRYRRPTLIDEEAVFEGWVTEVTERRVFSLGRIVQGGIVTVEAEGEFAVLTHADVDRMAAGRRAAFDRAMPDAAG